jgi:hypothetical protein
MGGSGTSVSGRRRWARRSCRTPGEGGAGGGVRRTVAAPATTAPRVTEGNGLLFPEMNLCGFFLPVSVIRFKRLGNPARLFPVSFRLLGCLLPCFASLLAAVGTAFFLASASPSSQQCWRVLCAEARRLPNLLASLG